MAFLMIDRKIQRLFRVSIGRKLAAGCGLRVACPFFFAALSRFGAFQRYSSAVSVVSVMCVIGYTFSRS